MDISKVFWFYVGSHEMYGPKNLRTVSKNAKTIVDALNANPNMHNRIIFKKVLTSSDEIKEAFIKANNHSSVIGVITWMHTFSPAKMWISGTKLLVKPLLHFVTQYNLEIPWKTIDMDYMNLHQSAHGDREYGHINARMQINPKIIVGHYSDLDVINELAQWQIVALGYSESHKVRVARFGDNMLNVAVTEGDKVAAQIQFGWEVDYYGIGDLVTLIDAVEDYHVEDLIEIYRTQYIFDYGDNDEAYFLNQVRGQARIELALTTFIETHGYNAITTNFEVLHGMSQIPGLAIQRLNERGIGFAGEGDWKTAALNRILKVMSNNQKTGFMEDYTYNLSPNNEYILQSHMLEVDPSFANDKPRLLVSPLDLGNKEDPARLVFENDPAEGIVVSMSDMGTHFRLLVNEIDFIKPTQAAPHLPVARILWKPRPSFRESVHQWIRLGGGHHTVASAHLSAQQMSDWASLFDLECIVIK